MAFHTFVFFFTENKFVGIIFILNVIYNLFILILKLENIRNYYIGNFQMKLFLD